MASSEPPRAGPRSVETRAAALHAIRSERSALGWCALGAVVTITWIVMPVGIGILFGTLIGFTLQPLHEQLKARLRRPKLAAPLVVALAALSIVTVTGAVATLFVTRGGVLTREMLAAFAPGGQASGFAEQMFARAARFGVEPAVLTDKLRDAATEIAARAASIATTLVEATAEALLALLFAMLTLHFILRNWSSLTALAEEALPLQRAYTHALLDEFRRVGRTTFLGTVATGLAQGILAAIGYWITGVPEPLFFGAATAVASLIPAVGTMLVWVPAGIVLILTGSPGHGIAELVWGILVIVSVSDYVIRPRLVGGDESTPTLVTFAAIFGGVEVFGLNGLIIGPVVMALALAVLRIYVREMRAARLATQR